MNPVVRAAALLLLGGVLVSPAAASGLPDPNKCTLGSNYPAGDSRRNYIPVTGYHVAAGDTIPDDAGVEPSGQQFSADWEVTVKDLGNHALVDARVCIDFSLCPDVQLSENQLATKSPTYPTSAGGGPNGSQQMLVGCSTICGRTNQAGKYLFKIMGRARNAGAPGAFPTGGGVKIEPGSGISYEGVAQLTAAQAEPGCAQFQANLVPLGPDPKVWIVDINGGDNDPAGAVNGADASQLLVEVLHGAAGPPGRQRARSDYNHDGLVNGADVSRMINFATVASLSGSEITGSRALGRCP